MQDCKLLLQKLNTVVRDLLLHLDVKMRVAKSFVACELSSKLITEVLAHLFRD